MSFPPKVYRAATICYHVADDRSIEMLFVIPSDIEFGGDRPQLCKGKVEGDESDLEAALREAKEEVGLFESNVDGDFHELGMFLGRTTVFVCKVKNRDMFGLPDFEIESTHWMTMDQFVDEGRQLHVPVVREAYEFIQEIEARKSSS